MTDFFYLHYQRFFEALAELGLKNIVLSPGGRSAPLAICAENNPDLKVWLQHDERTAGFFALGLAKKTKTLTALICTSGTAAANYTPAVIEAYQSGIPLLVLTADRPPTYRRKGFEQTIFQVGFYKPHICWSYEMPIFRNKVFRNKVFRKRVPNFKWHQKLAQKIDKKQKAGPIHINCPIDEPLAPQDGLETLTAKTKTRQLIEEKSIPELKAFAKLPLRKLAKIASRNPKGLILVGPDDYEDAALADLFEFSALTGWPILADGASKVRFTTIGSHFQAHIISSAHLLFNAGFYDAQRPDVILRVGPVPTNKILRTQIAKNPPKHFFWCDPKNQNFSADFPKKNRLRHPCLATIFNHLNQNITPAPTTDWTQLWTDANQKVLQSIDAKFSKKSPPLTEPEISYNLAKLLPANSNILLANSFAIRDFDAFAPASENNLYPMCNRGANGIDGLIATALGIAATSSRQTFLLTGDTAMLHDLSSLLSAKRLEIALCILIINNNGGAIFETLDVAKVLKAENSPPEMKDTFEKLFTAPTMIENFQFLNELPGVSTSQLSNKEDLKEFLAASGKILNEKPGIYIGEFITSINKSMEMRQNIKNTVEEKICQEKICQKK